MSTFLCVKVGVGIEAKLQEWFHLPQDMASPRWGEILGIQELTNSGWLRYRNYWWLNLFLLFLSVGTIQTVVMTAVQRTPRTVLLHSVSSQWAWARSYYLSVGRLTHQPAPSLLPYHLALDCVWTSRRGGSLFTMHTLCGCCGRGLLIAPPLFAQRSVLLVVVLCSCKS